MIGNAQQQLPKCSAGPCSSSAPSAVAKSYFTVAAFLLDWPPSQRDREVGRFDERSP
jgi:hypothetical protein